MKMRAKYDKTKSKPRACGGELVKPCGTSSTHGPQGLYLPKDVTRPIAALR
jgi:hypothetical protein